MEVGMFVGFCFVLVRVRREMGVGRSTYRDTDLGGVMEGFKAQETHWIWREPGCCHHGFAN